MNRTARRQFRQELSRQVRRAVREKRKRTSMALVTEFAQQRDIPHEPGESMQLRQLGWLALKSAADAGKTATFGDLRAMGGEIVAAIRDAAPAAADAPRDPAASYDRVALLHAGIVGWSYPEPVNPQTIARLDETTAAWAAREILAISAAGSGDETKNS